MGNKDSWFSCDGLAKRAAGVKQKESKVKKIGLLIFYAICFIVYTIIGVRHLSRRMNAIKIGEDYNKLKSEFDPFRSDSQTDIYFFAD